MEKPYPALVVVAKILRSVAVAAAVASVLLFIVGLTKLDSPLLAGAGWLGLIGIPVAGALICLLFLGYAESILLMVNVADDLRTQTRLIGDVADQLTGPASNRAGSG